VLLFSFYVAAVIVQLFKTIFQGLPIFQVMLLSSFACSVKKKIQQTTELLTSSEDADTGLSKLLSYSLWLMPVKQSIMTEKK
jgi:hypothetical protein